MVKSSILKKLLGEGVEVDHSNTMTVGQLIQELQSFSPEQPVYFEHPSHDHWHTMLAGAVSEVQESAVTYSDYHRQAQVQSDDDGNTGDGPYAVIIR